ncbi:MAG: helix-turn-helix transcriptional regulator [Clostridia bacterium]
MEFGEIIKSLRKQQKYTQQELADLLCLEKTTISKWENNKNYPNQNILTKLADIFNVSMDVLIGRLGKDNIFEQSIIPKTEIQQLFDKMNELQQIEIVSYAKGMLARGASSSGEQQFYSKKLKA